MSLNCLLDCLHAALAMIYPLEWHHLIIPLMPRALLHYLWYVCPALEPISPPLVPSLLHTRTPPPLLPVPFLYPPPTCAHAFAHTRMCSHAAHDHYARASCRVAMFSAPCSVICGVRPEDLSALLVLPIEQVRASVWVLCVHLRGAGCECVGWEGEDERGGGGNGLRCGRGADEE
jgi:hypothetical protein